MLPLEDLLEAERGRRLAMVSESSHWWVGVLLDMLATLAGTVGKQLLRLAAVSGDTRYYPLGLFCTAVIDPAFDLSAYSFAAQSIIAPCAGMVVVWNVLLAPYTLKERLTPSRLRGAILICVGTIVVGLFGNHNDVDRSVKEYLELFSRPVAVVYYVAFVAYSVAMVHVILRRGRFASNVALGALGGSLAGNMFTTKAVVEMADCLYDSGKSEDGCEPNPFTTPTPYLFAFVSLSFATAALYMLAVGLRSFEGLFMITVFEGFMIIFGALSGLVVMGEGEGQLALSLLGYALGIGLILLGLGILCRGEPAFRQEFSSGERAALTGAGGASAECQASGGEQPTYRPPTLYGANGATPQKL